jgi:hypothetical protein
MNWTEEEYKAFLDKRKQQKTPPKKEHCNVQAVTSPLPPTNNKPSKSKYHAQKTTVDGIIFDSKLEAHRYCELKTLEKAGKISDLRLQVPYELIPKHEIEGITIRATKYIADFVYKDERTGKEVVEDTKGFKTSDYKRKKKYMLQRYGIEIHEVN